MRKIIIATHGGLAEGMKNTAEMIMGEDTRIQTLSLMPGHHPDELKVQVEAMMNTSDDEYIILCDLFGGSVANALMHLCVHERVHVLTGVNLGLVIAVCTASDDEDTQNMLKHALQEASHYMLYANDLIQKEKGGKKV